MEILSFDQTGSTISNEVVKPKALAMPPKAESRNSKRRYNPNAKDLYWRRHLAEIYFRNEFLPRKEKLDKKAILDNLLKKFPKNEKLKRNFQLYRYTISTFRKWYNESRLVSSQPKNILVSIDYDKNGYPLVGAFYNKYVNEYIYFEEVRERCVDLKIADPRFIPYEFIVEIRNKQNDGDPEWLTWYAPTDKELKQYEPLLKLPVSRFFNSVEFPEGFRHEDTPVNFVPFEHLKNKSK
jgi:hypothetical protein